MFSIKYLSSPDVFDGVVNKIFFSSEEETIELKSYNIINDINNVLKKYKLKILLESGNEINFISS